MELIDPIGSKFEKELIELSKQSLSLATKLMNMEAKILTELMLDNVEPPIKGEITKGKLRWRGITMKTTSFTPRLSWIEQRGKRVTPIMKSNLDKGTFEIHNE